MYIIKGEKERERERVVHPRRDGEEARRWRERGTRKELKK